MKDISFITIGALGGQFQGSLLNMVLDAGVMVQFVLLLLLFFSVISWAIILMKYKVLRQVQKENDAFLDVYMKGTKLSEIFPESRKFQDSTVAEVFRSGYTELVKITKVVKESQSGKEMEGPDRLSLEMSRIDSVERALNRARDSESTKLESALGFLATTGSASPFIGLFGTVWGIMDTFKGIGARGSATLAVVAPGVSEALIATAAGLAAAIPAVIFYNYYLNRIKRMTQEMDNFSLEVLNIIERYYVIKQAAMKTIRRRSNTENKPMADINVTPLVDVVLVLLIIFMVTAPLLQMGIDVNLPRVKAKSIDVAEEKLILTITPAKEIFINKNKIPISDLRTKLEGIFSSRTDKEIFMRADKTVPYGFVIEVMSEVRKAGIDKLGMITESPEDAR